ncbi:hypothetical protein AM501_02905 [Aneurinibacillus migulanus]|uniref:nickel insertion protein n=1 Tax=Aneurinibacillus migulanus TaxID=47500 RepID=UPI0005B87D9C|nr:nickel insertion protein [Aneurinibacillus migulanus]KIV57715.1 hypothetical protein TS64_06140 [Aneurinibacillus migulanus]KPD09696.1 hypothetical protein AM501_02905 [Aneurinibacillus migulanus]MCP1358329.1 LarC family nickel insertion protein [Aneurinibacillus migulanus]
MLQHRHDKQTENISVLECQIDNMSGEHFGYVLPKLLEAGALDVFYTSVYMFCYHFISDIK